MKTAKYVFDKTFVLAVKQFARVVAYLVPRRRDLVVLGAWCGDRYADNPKFLAEYLLEKTQLNLVWVGKKSVGEMLPKHPRLKFAEMGSWAAMRALFRAKTWVCCISIEWDLTTWPIEGSARIINTWHGFGIKRGGNNTGESLRNAHKASLPGRVVKQLEVHNCPWLMVACEHNIGHLISVSPEYFDRRKILRVGTPIGDYILRSSHEKNVTDAIRVKLMMRLGIPKGTKIVTYLPTWRNSGVKVFSFYGLPMEAQQKWKAMLERAGAVLVEKHHPRTLTESPIVGPSVCSVPISLEQQKAIEVYELLLVTDVLISDCSGVYKDFGLLQRPCIHFLYDFDDYENNCSGFVEGWKDMLAGPVVKTEDELLEVTERNLVSPRFEPAPGYAKTVEFQRGTACESALRFIRDGKV